MYKLFHNDTHKSTNCLTVTLINVKTRLFDSDTRNMFKCQKQFCTNSFTNKEAVLIGNEVLYI